MKIKTKLVLSFVVVATVPVLCVAALVITHLRHQAEDNFVDASTREIRQVDNAMGVFFDDLGENVRYFAGHPTLAKMDGSITNYLADVDVDMAPDTKGAVEAEIYDLFLKFSKSHPGYSYVYAGNKTGGYIQWPKGKSSAKYDPRERPWYKKALTAPGQLVRTDAYYWAPDDAVIVSTALSFDNTLGKDGGVMAIDVSLKQLTDVVKRIKIGHSGYLLLVEDNGNVLVDAANPAHNFKQLKELGPAYAELATVESGKAEVQIDKTAYMATVYRSPKLGWRFIGLIERGEVFEGANRLSLLTLLVTAVLAALFAAVGVAFAGLIVRPIQAVSRGLREIAQGEGDLTRSLPVSGKDETAELAGLFNQFVSSIRKLVREISETANALNQASGTASSVSADMADTARRQRVSVDQASSAFHEVATAANDVAGACHQAAEAAERSREQAHEGEALIGQAVGRVRGLSGEIEQASGAIGELEKDSQSITAILATIQEIAAQTNLLALNAAIEAARAGEQGRGFAVVADEVRKLAERTTSSTLEIKTVLDTLLNRTQQVALVMRASRGSSDQTVSSIDLATSSFSQILATIDDIRDMNTRIATAAEEQHQIARNIDDSMGKIHADAGSVAEVAERSRQTSASLAELAANLEQLVGRFRT